MYLVTLDPKLQLTNTKAIYAWRFQLKRALLDKRGWKSDFSGKPISDISACHMHEGIVTRGIVPKSIWWHYLIFAEPNCFLLLPEEHIPKPPNREWCIQTAYRYYGKETVKEWYESLPFKVRPFQLL